MTEKEYMPLTIEDKILGNTKPREKTELEKKALSHDVEYYINTIGKDNKSVISGELLNSLLPLEDKIKLMKGETHITAKGFEIERITEIKEEKNIEVAEKPARRTRKRTT